MAERSLLTLARRNWRLVGVFLAALCVVLFFASRVFLDFLYFNDPRNVDVDLKPWMTPRFVVMTYDLPRPLVFEILALDLEADRGLRLRQVAERHGLTMEELTARVRDAAKIYREQEQ